MGQFVSTSGVVASYSLKRQPEGGRQCFIEHGDSFIPLVKPSCSYEFSLSEAKSTTLQIFTLQDRLIHEVATSGAGDRCSVTTDGLSSLRSGYYKVKLFDVVGVVFWDNEAASHGLPKFSNDLEPWLPDGADFRGLLTAMESDLQHLQKTSSWKTLLESITKVNDSLLQLSHHLAGVAKLPLPVFSTPNPLIQLINTDLIQRFHSFKRLHVDPLSKNISSSLLVPLQDFIQYNNQNQKTLNKNQKTFSEVTKSFYVNPTPSSSPFALKKEFELSRLDYYDYLYQSLLNGLSLRKLFSSVLFFLYNQRINESEEFTRTYIPKVNSLRSIIKKAQDYHDLNSAFSTFKGTKNFKEDIVLMRYLRQNDFTSETANSNDSSSTSSSSPNHWHRQWLTLNDHILHFYSNSKKLQNGTGSPFHQIDLSFACIKKVNAKTLEIITTGSLISLSVATPSTANPNLPAPAMFTAGDDIGAPVRFLLQLNNEKDMKSWLIALKQQPAQPIQDSTESYPFGMNKWSPNSSGNEKSSLLDDVKNQHDSNLSCCDCGSTDAVEWISINLLCVVCIKCSGVHRSMGSHISKIRSLTLDNFTSPELLQLIQNHVSNANLNSIYESLGTKEKIKSTCNDAERAQYIINKYQFKKFVDEGNQPSKKSEKSLIKAIHLNSVYLLQKCIAKSSIPLRDIIEEQKHKCESEPSPSIFQYSLKHHEMVNGSPVFYITEFLLINGIPIDKLPSDTSNWAPSVIKYWTSKLEIYGTYRPVTQERIKDQKTSSKSSSQKSTLPALNIPSDKSNKRWTLNSIPTSAQLKSPTTLLTMHKSLKLPKRGSNASNVPKD